MTQPIDPITAIPGKEEMQLRLEKVRSLIQQNELDCYVAAHTDNVYYLTNFAYIPFERPFFLIVPADGKPSLVVPLLEVDHAEQRILIDADYHTYYEYPAPSGKTFADVLQKVIPPSSLNERNNHKSSLKNTSALVTRYIVLNLAAIIPRTLTGKQKLIDNKTLKSIAEYYHDDWEKCKEYAQNSNPLS